MDTAQLLAQMMGVRAAAARVPEALAMQRSVIPCERLLSVEGGPEGAVARPVITPQLSARRAGR
ncbi:hypothetical protein ACFW91_36910 [Streptomyces asoensis]|uniref:hypothetical protein n=1 Tax=Streptomyces asoensis TaxID=249586 RepID=UPI0036B148E0